MDIDKEFFLGVYKEFIDPISEVKSKDLNEETLTKLVSRSNEYFNRITSLFYDDESVQKVCAVVIEISYDIKDQKAIDRAIELLDEHYKEEDNFVRRCLFNTV